MGSLHALYSNSKYVGLAIKSLYNRLFKLLIKVYLLSLKPFLFYVPIYNEYRVQQIEELTIFLVIGGLQILTIDGAPLRQYHIPTKFSLLT